MIRFQTDQSLDRAVFMKQEKFMWTVGERKEGERRKTRKEGREEKRKEGRKSCTTRQVQPIEAKGTRQDEAHMQGMEQRKKATCTKC